MAALSVAVTRRTRLVRFALFAALAGGLAAATGAPAQNLVGNGEFDFDISDWIPSSDAELDWHTADHDGCGAASGSAAARNVGTAPNYGVHFTSCVTGLVPGAEYSFEAFLLFPNGQAGTGNASVQLQWFDSTTDCDGAFVGNSTPGSPLVTTATPGVWTRSGWDSVTAPAGAHSALARVNLVKDQAAQELVVRFDGVHVARGRGIRLLDGFEIGSTCRWSSEVP